MNAGRAASAEREPARAEIMDRLTGYLLAGLGPILVSAANFVLSFSMLRLESPAAFGTFSFLFAAAAFLIALASALFAAPMQALFASGTRVTGAVACAATISALALWPVYAALGLVFDLGIEIAICYGAFATLTILRAVGRAWCYTQAQPRRVTLSDACYALATLGTFAAMHAVRALVPIDAIFVALALGTAAAVASLGGSFARLAWQSRRAAVRDYGLVWRDHSRWSLLGVSANEAAANAHIYALALLSGPSTVAPVAASALLLRPVNVIQNALAEFERGQIAGLLAARRLADVAQSLRHFRWALLLAWVGTVAVAAVILAVRPSLIVPSGYDVDVLRLAVVLWAMVWLVIVVQVPHNVLLQAGGAFRDLARASVCAALVSVACVLCVITVGQPVWTIAALLPGWWLCTVMVRRSAGRLVRARAPVATG